MFQNEVGFELALFLRLIGTMRAGERDRVERVHRIYVTPDVGQVRGFIGTTKAPIFGQIVDVRHYPVPALFDVPYAT